MNHSEVNATSHNITIGWICAIFRFFVHLSISSFARLYQAFIVFTVVSGVMLSHLSFHPQEFFFCLLVPYRQRTKPCTFGKKSLFTETRFSVHSKKYRNTFSSFSTDAVTWYTTCQINIGKVCLNATERQHRDWSIMRCEEWWTWI